MFYLAFAAHLAVVVGTVLIVIWAWKGGFDPGQLATWLRGNSQASLRCLFGSESGDKFYNFSAMVLSSKA
jgi:hypothetical protein